MTQTSKNTATPSSQQVCHHTTARIPCGINSDSTTSSSSHLNNQNNHQKPEVIAPHIAFIIPEIVERILSFIPFQDRQNHVCMVCREWNAICKDLVPITYTWLLNRDSTNDRDQVALAHNTILRSGYGDNWVKMMDTLSDVLLDCMLRGTLSKLKSLHLEAGVLTDFTSQLPQLPPLPFLTTLQIDFAAAWDIMHLFTIFKACPGLEELVVSDVKPTTIQFLSFNIQYSSVTNSNEEVALINNLHSLPVMTRLHTCSVENMMISRPALEAILQACPRLSKLILAQCTHIQRDGQGQTVYNQAPSIVKSAGTHCPHLRAFHISMSQDREFIIEHELAHIFETFPHMQEVSLMDRDMWRPSLVNELRTGANRVTTLNLIPYKRRFEKLKSTCLRDILCSFPHLLHLRARSALYRFEDMDLNDMRWQDNERHVRTQGVPSRRDYPRIPTDDMSIASQYIWACRGLRTLHISVIYHGSELAPLTIFGFLSRMCPRLEELHLVLGEMPLSLQGGFCLLTQLQHLVRLRITTTHYDSTDDALFWMQPISSYVITQDVTAYPHRHRQTLENIQKMPQFLTPPDVVVAGSTLVEKGREMGMDLSKIGHADDLQEWFDDRYGLSPNAFMHKAQQQQHIWPKLLLIWFEYSTNRAEGLFSVRPLKEIKESMAKNRPHVDFRLTRYHPDDYKSRIFKY